MWICVRQNSIDSHLTHIDGKYLLSTCRWLPCRLASLLLWVAVLINVFFNNSLGSQHVTTTCEIFYLIQKNLSQKTVFRVFNGWMFCQPDIRTRVISLGAIDNCNKGSTISLSSLVRCRVEDLATVTERTKGCARKCQHIVWRTRK